MKAHYWSINPLPKFMPLGPVVSVVGKPKTFRPLELIGGAGFDLFQVQVRERQEPRFLCRVESARAPTAGPTCPE